MPIIKSRLRYLVAQQHGSHEEKAPSYLIEKPRPKLSWIQREEADRLARVASSHPVSAQKWPDDL
jgi:hypothetical protein